MNLDFDASLSYICDKYNFKPCRFADLLENHGCSAYSIDIGDSYVLYDLVFFILSFIIGIFFVSLVVFYEDYAIKYKHQRAARGTTLWRAHIALHGFQILFWGIGLSLAAQVGNVQNAMLSIRYVFLIAAQAVLFFITLVDMQFLPSSKMSDIIYIIISSVAGLSALTMLAGGAATIIIYSLVVPLGVAAFHFFGMLPIILIRKLWTLLAYLLGMFVINVAPTIIDLFFNSPICSGTSGYLTGTSVSLIAFSLYRVFTALYFKALKQGERYDGLKGKRRLIDEPSTSEMNKPNQIIVEDYSYDYTYTDSSEVL